MKIPGTTKDVIESILHDYHFSVRDVAKKMGVSPKTIYALLRGKSVSSKTDMAAIALYVQLSTDKSIFNIKRSLTVYEKRPSYSISRPLQNRKVPVIPFLPLDGFIKIANRESA